MMRAPHLLALVLLAGCVSVPGSPVSAARTPTTTAASGISETPPTASGDIVFDAWAAEFRSRALAAGITSQVFAREMAGLTPDPRVAMLDGRQPEFSRPISDYIKGVVTAERTSLGQQKRAMGELGPIEQRYGVPRDILLSVWALESAFGTMQGDRDVIRSLATLAAEGRRRAWAEGELIAALKLIQTGEFPRIRLRGSWAGAMGQTQFIPTTFASTAVDGDGDGKRDIWTSPADALASAANLLATAGWAGDQGWAREVAGPPDFDYGLTEGPRVTVAQWGQRGVRPADGRPWSAADAAAPAQLVAPAGAKGPLFLLLPNHFVLRRYNNSLAYALGVGLLAERFSGLGGAVQPWPQETPLSLVDRTAVQQALAVLGFDPGAPDGVVGVNTRRALRAWQQARGLTADGYLSAEMVERLNAEASER